ncbi:MAG: hypothetical protein BM564_01900 [Bacteroidetes bacterium MedPE-SWsnd-G2]|nr:MAG: hypothetical protein BM564_01900 [Bacteroidetes bacterium MedPE-SWsnd-G2]
MKKVIKKGIVLATLICTMVSFGNVENVSDDNRRSIKTTLKLKNVKKGQLLTIKDSEGKTYYSEAIKGNGTFNKAFDLTVLKSGQYYFEIDKDVTLGIIPFTIKDGEIKVSNELEKTIYKPVVRVKECLIYVTQLALENEPLNVKIYYRNDAKSNSDFEEVYSETLEAEKTIERVYHYSKTQKGEYKLIFKSNGKVFTETFKV